LRFVLEDVKRADAGEVASSPSGSTSLGEVPYHGIDRSTSEFLSDEALRREAMEYNAMLELVFEVARDLARKGPGWAQQNAVLSEVANRVREGTRDERLQQQILTCWHDLFRLGRLSWGYNIDNPDAPFYHIPASDPQRDGLQQAHTRAG
jgi:hypothetical protein